MDDGRDAFIDLGRRIDVLAKGNRDDVSITTALQLAAKKYGGAFELTGSEKFKRRAIDIMVEHRIEVRLRDAKQEALRVPRQRPQRSSCPGKRAAAPASHGLANGSSQILGRHGLALR
nr:LPD7 domain-containing protein [Mycetohabitans sp. B8]